MNNNYNNNNNLNNNNEEMKKRRRTEREQRDKERNKIIDKFKSYYKNIIEEVIIHTDSWKEEKKRVDCDLVKEHGHIDCEEFNISYNMTIKITGTNLSDEQEYTKSITKKVDRVFHPQSYNYRADDVNINISLMEIREQKIVIYQKLINVIENPEN